MTCNSFITAVVAASEARPQEASTPQWSVAIDHKATRDHTAHLDGLATTTLDHLNMADEIKRRFFVMFCVPQLQQALDGVKSPPYCQLSA
jgi:hypothetical protein